MRFRTRLLVMLTGTVVLPVVLLSWLVRDNMTARLQTQNGKRVDAMASIVQHRFRDDAVRISDRLKSLSILIQNDNRLRSSLTRYDGSASSIDSYLIDFGLRHARLAGLTYFQIQDKEGVILTSGHFRNEFGRREKYSSSFRTGMDDIHDRPGVFTGRTPESPVLALARADSVFVAGEPYYLLGGFILDAAFLFALSPAANYSLCLEAPSDVPIPELNNLSLCQDSRSENPETLMTPAVALLLSDNAEGTTVQVRFQLVSSSVDLDQLLVDLDRWFLAILTIILTLGLISIVWVSRKISEPLSDLLYKTTRIDLNRLNISFKTRRSDEIGDLSRVLDELTRRLKRDAASLREVERRLAIGELARQVNHDIKNALAPIRNIVRHYSSLAHNDADQLAEVVREREKSLDASISYLEQLAGNYARLTPEFQLSSVDLDQLISKIVGDYSAARSTKIDLRLRAGCVVDTDEIAFRRILDNILDNAFDSLKGRAGNLKLRAGRVIVETKVLGENDGETNHEPEAGKEFRNDLLVQIVISDSGTGMNPEQIENAFKDFYSTKAGGTGLGLSIVRRLIMDLNGSVNLESSPGEGTRITIVFPARNG